MADLKPQNPDKSPSSPQASPTPQDYYAVLMKVITDVTRDPVQLRKLVYALAWQNLKPEVIVRKPIAEAQSQARNIFELEQALQLERAIERIEAEATGQDRKQPPSRPRVDASAAPTQPAAAFADGALIFQPVDDEAKPVRLAEQVTAPGVVPEPAAPAVKDLDAEPAATKPTIERDPEIAALDASFEPPRADGAVVVLPAQQAPPERKDAVSLERIPSWLDQSVRVSLDSVEYGPVHRTPERRPKLFPFLQLIAASAIGVVLYIGISGWVYLSRHQDTAPAPAPTVVSQQAQTPAPATEEQPATSQPQPAATRPASEPQPPALPFPLPRSYGVYAGVPGQLFELEQLPIKVPDPRVLVSAEITKPSTVTTPGDNLAFVVFRRDLVNSAPQTVTVRVVARVQRTTKFVDGKPAIVPMEGVWRIRAKAYEFKVSPLEGRNEMVVIQPNPGFVFEPGRYALVLNGFGYDFTVAGQVTAAEQCLEQVEVVNGAVLSECPKT